jgi:predicted CopG family antitoxin
MRKSTNKLTTIAVSKENYLALKRLGSAGDSFNDVVTEVIKKVKQPLQTEIPVGRSVA